MIMRSDSTGRRSEHAPPVDCKWISWSADRDVLFNQCTFTRSLNASIIPVTCAWKQQVGEVVERFRRVLTRAVTTNTEFEIKLRSGGSSATSVRIGKF